MRTGASKLSATGPTDSRNVDRVSDVVKLLNQLIYVNLETLTKHRSAA